MIRMLAFGATAVALAPVALVAGVVVLAVLRLREPNRVQVAPFHVHTPRVTLISFARTQVRS